MNSPRHNTIHMIANAHLDPIWLWRWQEGCNEVLQTFRSALDRLRETPGYVFTCSSACYYQWVEETDPAMFAEIVQAVKDGRWQPVNGWWVQPDCNLPSGESFARHALYSQLYYHEKFGKICRTGYNVDSFGHNGMMPQLLRQGGMQNYVMMRPEPHEDAEIPQNSFWWESPDGSKVRVFRIPTGYATHNERGTEPERIDKKLGDLQSRVQRSGHGMMFFYGIGNHGGGPTRWDLAHLQDKMQQEGYENLKFSHPDEFFADLCHSGVDLPVWKDDLQHHASGCYSSQSMVKQQNRRSEQALYFAEMFNTAAAKAFGTKAQTEQFKQAWLDVCFNHFHDILCGCSIMESYDDSRDSYGHANTIAARAAMHALMQFSRRINTWIEGCDAPTNETRHRSIPNHMPRPVVVFNALSFERNVPVTTTEKAAYVTDSHSNAVPSQNILASRFTGERDEDVLFVARVPAMGYALYWLYPESEKPAMQTQVQAGEYFIENEHLRAEFCSATGGISRLVNKASGRTVSPHTMAIPTVMDDSVADTWAHGIFKFDKIKDQMQLQSIVVLEHGPARVAVQIKHTFGNSSLLQTYYLAAGQTKLTVAAKALWVEPFTMLKLPLPMNGADEISTYEIPNGFIKRPCNGEEEPGLAWADLTVSDNNGNRHGIAVMSDSKYSYDCPGTELRLTALRNVIYADHCGRRPTREFDFTDEGLQKWVWAIAPHEGEADGGDLTRQTACLNNAPFVVQESYHQGDMPTEWSAVQISEANVLATAYKFCEDGSGDIILRCYETAGKSFTRAAIFVPQMEAEFWADFTRHEIKTFRINQQGRCMQVNFLEGVTL